MFIGSSPSQLDSENQITLPSGYLTEGISVWMVTAGFDQNLILIPEISFSRMQKSMGTLNLLDPEVRILQRMMLGLAEQIEITDDAKVKLSPSMLQFAKLINEVMVVGQGTYIEIWSTENWQAQQTKIASGQITFNSTISLSVEG